MAENFQKLNLLFDTNQLISELNENSSLFNELNFRKEAPGSPHKEMDDIWVRYNDIEPYKEKGSLDGFNDEHDSVWYPSEKQLPSVKPIVFKLMSDVQGERLGGILITKLPPGGKIDKHTDAGWHAGYYEKFYVAIQNNSGAKFCFDEGCMEPENGEVFWFKNSVNHWVVNGSNEDRIAMIVCIKPNIVRGV